MTDFSETLSTRMKRRESITRQSPCAVCRYVRRKCREGKCPLAPYFPADSTREVQSICNVFGVNNMTKMVLQVNEADRRPVVESLLREAFKREKDPVLGSYGEYARASNELIHLKHLVHANSGRIRQMQSLIMRMKGYDYDNGNDNNNMPVSSGHIGRRYQNYLDAEIAANETTDYGIGDDIMPASDSPIVWRYQNYPDEAAVAANETTINNNPMTSCMIEGIPFTGNMQSRLYIKNDNQEQAVASSSSSAIPLPQDLPPELPSEFLAWWFSE